MIHGDRQKNVVLLVRPQRNFHQGVTTSYVNYMMWSFFFVYTSSEYSPHKFNARFLNSSVFEKILAGAGWLGFGLAGPTGLQARVVAGGVARAASVSGVVARPAAVAGVEARAASVAGVEARAA